MTIERQLQLYKKSSTRSMWTKKNSKNTVKSMTNIMIIKGGNKNA